LIEVYKIPVRVEMTLDRASTARALTLHATYQGCNEQIGLCYPPIEKTIDMRLPR
jgi:thiol:disulfide interchange protein DsbD